MSKDGLTGCDYPQAEAALESFCESGRFPHAILIEGPDCDSRNVFVRKVAKAVLCGAEAGRPCGVCSYCKKVEAGVHPDLLIYRGEGRARSFHVDKVRELRAQAFVRPNESERKALLLEDCETMTEQAQNALLKVLEEPPASAVFLLTCRNRAQLLETIRSRVSVITLESDSFGTVENPHAESAEAFLRHMACGDELAALILLKPYERDRSGLVEWMEGLRAEVSRHILAGGLRVSGGKVDMTRLYGISDIIDGAISAAAANPGGMLLGAGLCARIGEYLEI